MIQNEEQISVYKIGGKVINDKRLLNIFLEQISKVKGPKVLIHGGGNKADQILTEMSIKPKMVEGRRITDARTLEVVTMVYGGLINKNIVAQLQSKGINAIGLSGADGNIIESHKRQVEEIDYGLVGDIDKVNATMLLKLCQLGLVPVLCALTHDKKGQLLNTNADTIAQAVSCTLAKIVDVNLKFCFELKGVLRDKKDESSILKVLSENDISGLRSSGVISDGIIPKLTNGFNALHCGVKNVTICHVSDMNIQGAGTKLEL